MLYAGTKRNWRVVGLTPDNMVEVHTEGDTDPHNSFERPSEFWGLTYLMPRENRILRRGLTASGKDRREPR
jgi:hypothetical protein